jgi:hypothetical protein
MREYETFNFTINALEGKKILNTQVDYTNKLNKEVNLLLKAIHEYQFKHRENADQTLIKQVLDHVTNARQLIQED